jgi:hypothetical protein
LSPPGTPVLSSAAAAGLERPALIAHVASTSAHKRQEAVAFLGDQDSRFRTLALSIAS